MDPHITQTIGGTMNPRPIKQDIVYNLFYRGDELSRAAGSEILRLRQLMQSVWGIYYSNEYKDDETRFRKMIYRLNEGLSENPNYPNYY